PSYPAPTTSTAEPATHEAVEPDEKAKGTITPAIDDPKKDTLIDKLAKRERSAAPPSKKERATDVARDSLKQRGEQDEVRTQTEAPVGALSKSAEEVTSPADPKLAASSPPSATVPE